MMGPYTQSYLPLGDLLITLKLRGRAPAHVDPNYYDRDDPVRYDDAEGMRFEVHMQGLSADGRIRVDADGLHVQEASEALLLVSAATSFNGFDTEPGQVYQVTSQGR